MFPQLKSWLMSLTEKRENESGTQTATVAAEMPLLSTSAVISTNW